MCPLDHPAMEALRDKASDPEAMASVAVTHYARIAAHYGAHSLQAGDAKEAEVYFRFAADLLASRSPR